MEGTFYPVNDYRNYLEHFGVKGMKWGVRRYRNEDGSLTEQGKRHESKERYKALKKVVRESHRELDKAYRREYRSAGKKYSQSVKEAKSKLREGSITNEEYKKQRRELRGEVIRSREQSEATMAIGHYAATKVGRAAKAKYISEVKGENSKAYQKAVRAAQRSVEGYGNYVIERRRDGTFSITRIDVY